MPIRTSGSFMQNGVALVLVLWMLSLMAIMAGSFALSMRRQTAIVAGIKNNARAQALAESGIALAESMLLVPDPNKRWRSDGNVYQIDYADNLEGTRSKVRIRILSETGKIDINTADLTLLQGIMVHAPIEENQRTRLTSAILDWRDQDDLINIEGAEKKEYKEAGLSYEPRNNPFRTVEELQLVLGITEPVYKWLDPLITVNSGQKQVDLQQASKEVLGVLPGIDAGMADTYLSARLESAKTGAPAPAFQSGSGQAASAAGQSNALTIVSEALLDDGASALISVLVAKSQGISTTPFQVLKWQHAVTDHASLFTDEMSQLLVREYAEPEFNH